LFGAWLKIARLVNWGDIATPLKTPSYGFDLESISIGR
jgi:hypothetical protein